MRFIPLAALLVLFGLAFYRLPQLVYGQDRCGLGDPQAGSAGDIDSVGKIDFWTCSMHPQIKLPEAGQCPICRMDLIPVRADSDEHSGAGNAATLKLSPAAERLAELQTTPVKREALTKELRMVGTIDYDETRLSHITAWVPGRIDRMFVDYTGITVKKGDHMVELYSPELISTQEELIQARRSIGRLRGSNSDLVKASTQSTVRAAREKLYLLGLTEEQVLDIEKRGTAADRMTIYAPVGGVVVERNATDGMYVQTGTRIYSIADLSELWVYFDAYESDLPWIRYGQKVEFSTQAIPGRVFAGQISFISPIVDRATRTTKVRVTASNLKGLLKPGLFVSGVIKTTVFAEGKVIDTSLRGKFVGPMHPEMIRDQPGTCPVCGMELVPAEELGYFTDEEKVELPLVIPESAPLITGKRAVVYVKDPERSVYGLQTVTLGPKAGGFYIVIDGLREGELVVTRGAFKIDADLQIRGKQSMMNPEGGKEMSGHAGHGG